MRFAKALPWLSALSLVLSACATSPESKPVEINKSARSAVITDTVIETAVEQALLANAERAPETPDLAEEQPANIIPPVDAWQRLRSRFSMPQPVHKRIQRETDWYSKHPSYLDRVADRATPYMHYIIEEIEKRNIPGEIALLPIVESAFQPFAYSHGRAAGIWQFIPGTGKHYGLKQNWWYDGRRDVYASTQAALDYLQALNREFKGDWMLALAAYNAGSGNVRKAIRKNKKKGRPTDFFSLKLPKETQAYVPRLLAISRIIADPHHYGLTLKSIPNEPQFERVDVGGQLDLALAAEMADIDLQELYQLNPGFNRWATPPKGPHHLLVPIKKAEGFKTKLSALPKNERVRWKRHKIKNGETLGHIADKHRITVAELKRVNKIRGNFIRAGNNLIIPTASKSARSYSLSAENRKQKILNAPKSGRNKIIHTVSSGDTLWDIARHYGVGVRSLAKWNAMAPRDTLQRGQKLVVWTSHKSGKVASRSVAPPVSLAKSGNGVVQRVNYVVRRGDSLARIASKFRVTVRDVLRWNKRLSSKKYLQPGQRVKLFVDITKQAS